MKHFVTATTAALKESRFFTGFTSGMRPYWRFSVRLDEFPYFITWPLVYLLAMTRVTPNQLVLLSFMAGLGFLAGLYQGIVQSYPIVFSLLLLLRVFLDCADGQLARYSNQTSNLGALYDLVADFVFALALFAILGYSLITIDRTDPGVAVPVCIIALICFLVSSTVFSYISSLERSPDLYPAEVRRRFISPLSNDYPEKRFYRWKLRLFNLFFLCTWRLVSIIAFVLVISPEKTELHESALKIMAPLEYGMQLTVLALMVMFQVNLVYFLIFEITGFCVLFLILLYHYRT